MNPVMRLCPRCRMVSYVSTMTWDATCPHCSFNVGKWLNRRFSSRREIQYPVIMRYKSTFISGSTLDYSDTGMKISYKGSPLTPGDRIHIEIKGLAVNASAKVVWLRVTGESRVHAGIEMV